MNASPAAEALLSLFQLQNGIFENALDGLDDATALSRPGQVNHINWLLGHITTCRYMLAKHIGLELEDPNGKLYFTKISDLAVYANLEEIKQNWNAITLPLFNFIGSLSDAALKKEIPGTGNSVKSLIAFFAYHEAYHLGQIGYARKLLGVQAMRPY